MNHVDSLSILSGLVVADPRAVLISAMTCIVTSSSHTLTLCNKLVDLWKFVIVVAVVLVPPLVLVFGVIPVVATVTALTVIAALGVE